MKRWKDLRCCVMQAGLIPAISMPEVMTMKASVLCDVQRLEVRDIPRPVISPYEVLIRVAAVGQERRTSLPVMQTTTRTSMVNNPADGTAADLVTKSPGRRAGGQRG